MTPEMAATLEKMNAEQNAREVFTNITEQDLKKRAALEQGRRFYEVVRFHWGYVVMRTDPGRRGAWYLSHVTRGRYVWYHSSCWGRGYSEKTALKHLKALENGADEQ